MNGSKRRQIGDLWAHVCRKLVAELLLSADRCPHCGEISPRRQAEIDAEAVRRLREGRDSDA